MASGAMLLNFRLTLHAVFLCPVHLFNAELRIGESRQPWVSRQSDMTAAAQGADRIFGGQQIDQLRIAMQIHHAPPRQLFSLLRPRRIHDLTVPSGTVNVSAISLWL